MHQLYKKVYANNSHNGYQGDTMLRSQRCPTRKMHLPHASSRMEVCANYQSQKLSQAMCGKQAKGVQLGKMHLPHASTQRKLKSIGQEYLQCHAIRSHQADLTIGVLSCAGSALHQSIRQEYLQCHAIRSHPADLTIGVLSCAGSALHQVPKTEI